MKLVLYLLISLCGALSGYAQNDGRYLRMELPTYQAREITKDSISCDSAMTLRYSVEQFNFAQLERAYRLADSLNQAEYPCYEFVVEQHCDSHSGQYFETPQDCFYFYSSRTQCVNGRIRIYQQRRSSLSKLHSGSTFCR